MAVKFTTETNNNEFVKTTSTDVKSTQISGALSSGNVGSVNATSETLSIEKTKNNAEINKLKQEIDTKCSLLGVTSQQLFSTFSQNILQEEYLTVEICKKRLEALEAAIKDATKNGKLDKDLSNIEVSNIENFDGQWINSTFEILSNATANGNTGYQYDLSNYLPNNNKKYEVLFTVWGQTGESSGNGLYIWAGTDIIGSGTNDISGKAQILRIRAVNSYAQYGAGSVILPVGTGRKLYLYFTNNANASGINVEALGYRRIGTNM